MTSASPGTRVPWEDRTFADSASASTVRSSILDHERVAEMITTNVAGTVWSVRAAVPALRAAGGGDVVMVASVAGLRSGGDEAVYAGTKSAQVGLAGALDRELRAEGIQVTAIYTCRRAHGVRDGYRAHA